MASTLMVTHSSAKASTQRLTRHSQHNIVTAGIALLSPHLSRFRRLLNRGATQYLEPTFVLEHVPYRRLDHDMAYRA